MPVEGWVGKEPVEGILGNGAFGMLGMQESEQVLILSRMVDTFFPRIFVRPLVSWRHNRQPVP